MKVSTMIVALAASCIASAQPVDETLEARAVCKDQSNVQIGDKCYDIYCPAKTVGPSIKTLQAHNVKVCASYCGDTSGCVAAVWEAANGACTLHKLGGRPVFGNRAKGFSLAKPFDCDY